MKLSGIVVRGNAISNTHYWVYTKNVPPIRHSANKFKHVVVPIKQI